MPRPEQPSGPSEEDRLQFARWLVQTGRVSDNSSETSDIPEGDPVQSLVDAEVKEWKFEKGKRSFRKLRDSLKAYGTYTTENDYPMWRDELVSSPGEEDDFVHGRVELSYEDLGSPNYNVVTIEMQTGHLNQVGRREYAFVPHVAETFRIYGDGIVSRFAETIDTNGERHPIVEPDVKPDDSVEMIEYIVTSSNDLVEEYKKVARQRNIMRRAARRGGRKRD